MNKINKILSIFLLCLIVSCNINFFVPNKKHTQIVWESIGPFAKDLTAKHKHIGKVQTIWVNPRDTSEIFIGSNAGMWKTSNGGKFWNCITEKIPFGVYAIEVDTIKNIIYIGTNKYTNGLLASGNYGMGIMKSTDWGETWTSILPSIQNRIGILDICYSHKTKNLYAISKNTIFRSLDEGKTWDTTFFAAHSFNKISENSQNPEQLCVSGKVFFLTTNNFGNNWISCYDSIFSPISVDEVLPTYAIAADYSPAGLLWVYACPANRSKAYLKKSVNNGNNWETIINKQNLGGQFGAVVVNKVFNDSIIFCGGGTIYKILNNGTQKKRATQYNGKFTHADVREVCFPDKNNSNLIYIVTDGGINKTTTGGNTYKEWKQIYGNLALNECYTISISEQNPEIMLMGAHDNGTYMRYADGSWEHIRGGDGGTTLISWENDSVMFCAANRSLKASYNRCKNFKGKTTKLYSYDGPLVQHPIEPNVYYAGDWGIKKTIDNGKTWKNYTSHPVNRYVTAIALCRSEPEYFMYSNFINWGENYGGILIKYNISTKKWDNISDNIASAANSPSIMDSLKISSIEFHSVEPKIAWVTFSYFGKGDKVFQTNDYGETWTNISYNLENVPVNTVIYDHKTNCLFIGTDTGVYFLTKITKSEDMTWKRYGDFPYCIASDIKINNNTREIIVATFGRGIWRTNLFD